MPDLLWADDDAAWGIEFMPGEEGNYWRNQWRVGRENGEGSTIAVFEFEDHAAAFVERCGPDARKTDGAQYEPVGLLVGGWEFIPEDVYRAHLPFAVPPDVKVQRLYAEAADA